MSADASPAAAPSEIEVSSPVVWEAFILDESGFVISSNEDLDEIIALFPDEHEISLEYGDVFPHTIEIVSGTAMPQPQSPGSPYLRSPSSHYVTDKIFDYDLEQVETSEDLRLIWAHAKAMAEGLNRYEATR